MLDLGGATRAGADRGAGHWAMAGAMERRPGGLHQQPHGLMTRPESAREDVLSSPLTKKAKRKPSIDLDED